MLTAFIRYSLLLGASLGILLSCVENAQGYNNSHNSSMQARTSYAVPTFVTLGIQGELGKTEASLKSDTGAKNNESLDWRGSAIYNELGLELLKFVQFNVSHAFLNKKAKSSDRYRLLGSRLGSELRLVFSSPVINLELGAGATGSFLDMQRELETTAISGTGFSYSFGVNYFLSPNSSVYGTVRHHREQLRADSDSSDIDSVQQVTSSAGLGIRLWI